MCLLVVAWQTHPRYRLIVAGNRDEFHERPAAPLGWWSDAPGVLAGRDLRAGGTWLGLSRSGRFGLVTNFRDADATVRADAPSRGELVPAYLRNGSGATPYLDELQQRATQYAGFNLLLGDATGLHYYTNVGGTTPRVLSPGIYGLSNHRLDEPWPKLVRTRERFAAALRNPDPAPAALLDLLGDTTPAAFDTAPDAGLPADLERALSAPFVRHERYGTRCSTVVLVTQDGSTTVYERRFESSGTQSGASRFEFAGQPG
jgi:uncharacterized protein with NRDE domain